jgi:hypothetical protein
MVLTLIKENVMATKKKRKKNKLKESKERFVWGRFSVVFKDKKKYNRNVKYKETD